MVVFASSNVALEKFGSVVLRNCDTMTGTIVSLRFAHESIELFANLSGGLRYGKWVTVF